MQSKRDLECRFVTIERTRQLLGHLAHQFGRFFNFGADPGSIGEFDAGLLSLSNIVEILGRQITDHHRLCPPLQPKHRLLLGYGFPLLHQNIGYPAGKRRLYGQLLAFGLQLRKL